MLFRDRKGLSPVVSAIILIAVTVAVAVAATTWLGSISFSFMTTEELQVTGCRWAADVSYVDLTVQNFGTDPVTVGGLEVNGVSAGDVSVIEGSAAVGAGEAAVFRVTQSFVSSRKYEFTVVTSSGTKVGYFSVAPSSVESCKVWYDSSWVKRKMSTVDNSLNPDDLSDFQVVVDVLYDSDMKPDFSDLRFTDGDAETLIPFWVESYVESVSARVWVRVPFVSASSSGTVYMYYGNPVVGSVSDPDATFDLFIDFARDGVISYGGGQDGDPGQWEIIDDTVLRMWGNNWKASMRGLDVVGDGSQVICFDFKSEGTQAEINGVGLDTDSSISDNRFYRVYGTQNWGINDHYGYGGGGDWQTYSLVLDNFGGSFDRFVFTNDADGGQATNVYYRNVRVSKYVASMPSIDFSEEENFS